MDILSAIDNLKQHSSDRTMLADVFSILPETISSLSHVEQPVPR
jgi:hypothetical protein